MSSLGPQKKQRQLSSNGTSSSISSVPPSVHITEENFVRTQIGEIERKHKLVYFDILAIIKEMVPFTYDEDSKKEGMYMKLLDESGTFSFVLWDLKALPLPYNKHGSVIGIKEAVIWENKGPPFLCTDENTVCQLMPDLEEADSLFDWHFAASLSSLPSYTPEAKVVVGPVTRIKDECIYQVCPNCNNGVEAQETTCNYQKCKSNEEFTTEKIIWKFRFLLVKDVEVILNNDLAEEFFKMKAEELAYWKEKEHDIYQKVLKEACDDKNIYKWNIHALSQYDGSVFNELIDFEDITFPSR